MASRSQYLEDFKLGQLIKGEEFELTSNDLRAFSEVSGDRHPMHDPSMSDHSRPVVAHGPLGLAKYFGHIYDNGWLQESVIALLDTNWRYIAPLRVGVRLHFETTITGWRRCSSQDRGVVRRSVELLDDNGSVVQSGTSSVMVHALNKNAQNDPVHIRPLSLQWAQSVVETLGSDESFRRSIQLFDGTIGLSSASEQVQFRLYKGKILEVADRTPLGSDFTVHGSDAAWTGLLTGPENDLLVRAHRGEFSASGNVYMYLQLTKALHLLVDAARVLTESGK